MVDHGRSNYYLMTNKSGGTVTKGQTVVIDTGNNIAFTTSTTSGDFRAFGIVADASILSNAIGQIQIMGSIVPVLAASAAVTRGHYIKQGTVAGKVIDTTVACAAAVAPPTGAIGVALTGVGAAGNIVAYLFNTSPGTVAGATTFLGLSDVPASYAAQALKAVRVNAGATALEFYTPGGGVSAFTGLSDVPASYSGQAYKGVRVNAGETALEFVLSNGYNVDDFLSSPNAMDDEFNDATAMSGPNNGLDGQWAWRNQSTAAITFPNRGVLKLAIPAASGHNWRIIEQAVAAGDFSFVVKAGLQGPLVDLSFMGIGVIDRTNGDFYVNQIACASTGTLAAGGTTGVARWDGVSTFNANLSSIARGQNVAWLRIDRVSTTLNFYYSDDGISWIRSATTTDAVNVNGIALMANETGNTGTTAAFFRHFRRLV